MRKRTNALRRRYQRTTNNQELRENRKNKYTKAKKEYLAAIKRKNKIMKTILHGYITKQSAERDLQTT